MQQNRFVVLTGHLSNYPLSDLVGILRHQRKTGRLLIEYPKGPASFFFQDGALIDARLNDLCGLQAVCVALSLPESSFNFNPLVRATKRSIDQSLQRVVSELVGCWDESALQIESTATVSAPPPLLTTQQADDAHTLPPAKTERAALPPAQLTVTPRRYFLASSALLILIGLPLVIAMNRGFRSARTTAATTPTASAEPKQESVIAAGSVTSKRDAVAPKVNRVVEQRGQDLRGAKTRQLTKDALAAPVATASNTTTESNKDVGDVAAAVQSVNVVMQIENGRILKASVTNHRPGMESYEALALRIARQRRYPDKISGEQTVRITVTKPN